MDLGIKIRTLECLSLETTRTHVSGLDTLKSMMHLCKFQLTVSLGSKRSHVLVSAGLVYLDGTVASESDNIPLVLAIDRF